MKALNATLKVELKEDVLKVFLKHASLNLKLSPRKLLKSPIQKRDNKEII
ncbi:hypothetical protein [Paenibacillus sp. TC-CSREp1]